MVKSLRSITERDAEVIVEEKSTQRGRIADGEAESPTERRNRRRRGRIADGEAEPSKREIKTV
ncbi:hypothetical protein F2Q68_00042497 [Brassica cretica]|uniref:Uncharacterized protein n=1 Tax=Brassica cretica TaxID=69181 RepID=A0A8S9MQP2_BRACR|nr:hypothetical protein F2Q68_00042497 [Brassica cretica]